MTPQEKLLDSLKIRDVEGVREALEMGAVVNNSDSINNTIGWALSKKNPLEVIELLVEHGAVANNSNNEFDTLHWALRGKNPLEVIKLLFEHGAVTNNNHSVYCTLSWALCERKPLEVELIEFLCQNGALCNDSGDLRNDCLRWSLMENNPLEVFKILFKHGAVIDNSNSDYNTLRQALRYDHPLEVIKLLFEHGAKVNNTNNYYNTLCCVSKKTSPEVIELLFENGADPESLPQDHPRRQEMIDIVAKKEEKSQNNQIAKSIAELVFSKSGEKLDRDSVASSLSSDLISVIGSFAASNKWNENEVERTAKMAKGFHESYSVKDNQRKERAEIKTQSTPTAAAVEDEEEIIPSTSIRPASPAVKQNSNQNPDKSKGR